MGRLRRILWVLLFVAMLVAGWTFAAGNGDPVIVRFGFGASPELSLWQALGVAFLVGAGGVAIAAGLALARRNLVERRYRITLEGLREELHQLRNLPLAADAPSLPASSDAPAEGGAREGG